MAFQNESAQLTRMSKFQDALLRHPVIEGSFPLVSHRHYCFHIYFGNADGLLPQVREVTALWRRRSVHLCTFLGEQNSQCLSSVSFPQGLRACRARQRGQPCLDALLSHWKKNETLKKKSHSDKGPGSSRNTRNGKKGGEQQGLTQSLSMSCEKNRSEDCPSVCERNAQERL